MPCYVCQHNQVKDIDRALLSGASLSHLSQTYGFSTSALLRHQEQLRQKMAQAEKRFHDGLRQGLFCKLNIVLEMVLDVVRGANAGEDFKLFLQASREVSRIISLMLKMDVHLEPEMIYCLMASPQWDLQDSLLPNSFQALAQTRQTLKVNLYAPCPEPELDQVQAQPPILETQNSAPETPDLIFSLGTRNSELETSPPTDALADQSQNRTRNDQPQPGLAPSHPTENWQPSEIRARN